MNIAIGSTVGNQPIFEPLTPIPIQNNLDNLSVIEKIKRILHHIKDKLGAFMKEAARLAISALHIVSNCEISDSVTGFPSTMTNTAILISRKIAALGLISFIKAVINTLHALFKVDEAVDKALINDTEGSVIASLDVVGSSIETIYDVEVGLVAFASLGAISFNISFCMIAMPCAILPLIHQICKLSYFIIRHHQFIHSIPGKDNVDILTSYLDDKLGTHAKKLSILERHTDERVVKLMKKMRIHLNSDQVDLVKIEAAKDHIKKFMWRKIALESVDALVDIAMLVTLIAGLIIPSVPSHLVHIIGGIKSVQSFVRKGVNYLLHRWEKKQSVFIN